MPHRRCRYVTTFIIAVCLISNVACLFPKTVNEPLTNHAPGRGYRFQNLDLGPKNSDDTFVCLTLSGGGTRASALAYGVMLGLRDAELAAVPSDRGRPGRTVLDEVDIISSVSGGSFAAMGFGILGDAFFDGIFRERVLELDLQAVLINLLLNPLNALRLPSVVLDRIDVAAEYYDERIFDRKTFADLVNRKQRPFIVINATNLAISERVEFTQGDFDMLASDLGSVPVGWAVAASSAFPVVFSPLRFKYHHPPSESNLLGGLVATAEGSPVDERRQRWARHITTRSAVGTGARFRFDHRRHRYLYLADGGLVDNLGLAHVIDSHQRGDIRRLLDSGAIRRLIVISVDAGVETASDIEQWPSSPGILMQTIAAASIGVDNSTRTLVRVMNHLMTEEPRMHAEAAAAVGDACPEAVEHFRKDRPVIDRHFIHVGFHLIKDQEERQRFDSIPTRLSLPKKDVDDLVELGRRLVIEELQKNGLVGSRDSRS